MEDSNDLNKLLLAFAYYNYSIIIRAERSLRDYFVFKDHWPWYDIHLKAV